MSFSIDEFTVYTKSMICYRYVCSTQVQMDLFEAHRRADIIVE